MSDELPPFKVSPAFNFTQPPTPGWSMGEGLRTDSDLTAEWKAEEDQGYKVIDPEREEPR
jgi:hypothetical protein